MGLKILQLSDLHLGKDNADALEIASSVRDKEIDFILFLGDIIDGEYLQCAAYKTYIEEAVAFFHALIYQINTHSQKKKLSETDVFFIPGNHEIDRKNYMDKSKIWDKYEEFLTAFYGENSLPSEYDKRFWSFLKLFEKEKVIILGFNSANYGILKGADQTDATPKDYAEISTKQIHAQIEKLENTKNLSNYSIVACLHHHFYLIEERSKTGIDASVLQNSNYFLDKLNKFNLKVIIHGHKHRNSQKRILINDGIGEKEKIATVISSGSLAKKDMERNYFRYLQVFGNSEPLELINITYQLESTLFRPQAEFRIPMKTVSAVRFRLLELLESESELYKAYSALREIDQKTPAAAMLSILDHTIGALQDTLGILRNHKKCLFYIFLAVHFRYNVHEKNSPYLQTVKDTLLQNLGDDFKTAREQLFALYTTESIYEVQCLFKNLVHTVSDLEKQYLTFAMIGIYLTELYLSLSSRSEEFFHIKIKSKTDIHFQENKIKTNVKGNAIVIDSDEERRAIEVSVECMEATAHKVISLILVEYEMLLNEFDQYFMKQGFRLYYIHPQIQKFKDQQLESYTFSAYIPKLVPLLAGENIYSSPEVFARELIQNSIDAINMRPQGMEEGKIKITLAYDPIKEEKTFTIEDNGSGMNKYILERYFTSIGRSFYKSDDFEKRRQELKKEYHPISQFGIGFLSCFLVGKRIEVYTKYCGDSSTAEEEHGWFLDVPNLDGCFFIEETKLDKNGTKIKIYEDKEKGRFAIDKILAYIKNTILNPPYDIIVEDTIKNQSFTIHKNAKIHAILSGTEQTKLFLFVPFTKDGRAFNFRSKLNFWDTVKKSASLPYGMFLYKQYDKIYAKQNIFVCNDGIRVRDSDALETHLTYTGYYFDIFLNFQANQIDLDVSRDCIKATSLFLSYLEQKKSFIDKNIKNLKSKLAAQYQDTTFQKLPYFILTDLGDTYPYEKLLLVYENNKYTIKLDTNCRYTLADYSQTALHLLQFFLKKEIYSSAEIENSSLYQTKDIDTIYQMLFIIYFYIARTNYFIDSSGNKTPCENFNIDKDMARARARAKVISIAINVDMARAGNIARDIAGAMARARDIDIDIDVARDIARARDMARDRARVRDMARAIARAIDTARDMARAIDTARDRDMTRDMARDIARVRDMARAIDIDIDLIVASIRKTNILSKKQESPYNFEMQKIIFTVYTTFLTHHQNKEPNFLLNLLFANFFTPIVMSYFLTLEELQNGYEFQLTKLLQKYITIKHNR